MDFTQAPSTHDIEALAAEAIEYLPFEFKKYLGDFTVQVEEFPDLDVEVTIRIAAHPGFVMYRRSLASEIWERQQVALGAF